MSLARGSVVLVDLEPTQGHEQQGNRPCVVVPITGTPAQGALYPSLAPGVSGLTKPSTALVNQLRSIDSDLCLYLGLEP